MYDFMNDKKYLENQTELSPDLVSQNLVRRTNENIQFEKDKIFASRYVPNFLVLEIVDFF